VKKLKKQTPAETRRRTEMCEKNFCASPKKIIRRSLIAALAAFGILATGQAKDALPIPDARAVSAETEDYDWPSLELKKDSLRLLLAVPDPVKGFYRGARFDQSGFIYRAQLGNLQLFGPWRDNFKRGQLDAVTGPAGEFGMKSPLGPLGYDEAAPGGGFVKIGVGHLKRIDDTPYSFSKNYEILDAGKWTVSQGETFFESSHQLAPLRGWAYEYTKRIDLPDATSIKISYKLKNTGSKEILTDYYAHNLLVFNHEFIAAGDSVEILADLAGKKIPEPAGLTPRKIEFQGPIKPNKGHFLEMPLPKDLKNPVLARIFNKKANAAVTLSADYSPYKLDFYGHDKALCIEPFLKIDLKPGEELSWSDTYQIERSPNVAR
jgi:hypothetical protein